MMTHEQAVERTPDYFANRLTRSEVKDFHAHISDCEDCRVRLRTLKASLPRPGFTLGVEQQREARLQEILRRNRVMVYAVVAVLICFFFFFRLKQG
jgi:hypothetical protein